MDKSFVTGKIALLIATVGLDLSLTSFRFLMTFRASGFPAKFSR